MTYTLEDVARTLRGATAGHGSVFEDGNVVWALPHSSGSPIRATVRAEHVSIRAGYAARIRIPDQQPTDLLDVFEVVVAIVRGDLEEYFGIGPDHATGYCGHRVWYPRGSRTTLDEQAQVLSTQRSTAWR